MAKTMARLNDNNTVINIEWCSDSVKESNTLKEVYDYSVCVNDIYQGGYYYRDGEKVLTPLESAYKQIDELTDQQEELITSYNDGVNSI